MYRVRGHYTLDDLANFADSSIDLVYSFAVFQHVPDPALVYRYIAEAFRVLKPGGLFTAQFNGIPRPKEEHNTWAGVGIAEVDCRSTAYSILIPPAS